MLCSEKNAVKLWNDCVMSLLMLAFKCLSAWKLKASNINGLGKTLDKLSYDCESTITFLSRVYVCNIYFQHKVGTAKRITH